MKDVYSSLIRSLVLHYSSASSCFSTHTPYPLFRPLLPALSSFRGSEPGVVTGAVPGVHGCIPPKCRGVLVLDTTGGNSDGSRAREPPATFSVSNTMVGFEVLSPTAPRTVSVSLCAILGEALAARDTDLSLFRGDIRARGDFLG